MLSAGNSVKPGLFKNIVSIHNQADFIGKTGAVNKQTNFKNSKPNKVAIFASTNFYKC